jgi:hypothetical protein
MFDMVVETSENGGDANICGTDVAMLGDATVWVDSWDFNIFRNRFVEEREVW